MGDHKHEYCRSGRHKMEGHNVITRENGLRACRACQYERVAKDKREQRAPRLRWARFTVAELAAIHRALVKAPVGNLPQNMYQTTERLLREVIQQFDERRLANQKQH